MLSAQRREFDDKKKEESPYPLDFARWYALDYFRRPRKLKSRRFYVTFAVAVACLLLSLASVLWPALHRTHQAAPVSKSHAMFEQNCANCHDRAFQPIVRLLGGTHAVSVTNESCNKCHDGTIHHARQAHEPDCASCHREHQGSEIGVLASHVADRRCTECHGDLPVHLKPNETTTFQPRVTSFDRDHPEFAPSAQGKKDPSKIRFSHQAHLDLHLDDLRQANEKSARLDLKGLGSKMQCVDCHRMDERRRSPLPIKYDNHCARCHALNIALAGEFADPLKPAAKEFGKAPLPHEEPATVRAVLRDRLVAFAQRNKVVPGIAESSQGKRKLPWKPSQPVSDEEWTWATNQTKKTEETLFMNKQWTRLESLEGCARCHIEKERLDGLPVYFKTDIPRRWYKNSVFDHGSHRMTSCVQCHDQNAAGVPVAQGKTAQDILLPTLNSCRQCHHENGGARSGCVECHRYHDRTRERSPDGLLTIQDIVRMSK